MGRKVDVNDLVGAADIASRLGLRQVQTVHLWRDRHDDFPMPVAQAGRVLIWAWPDIERWARGTGRLPNGQQ